jgi:hypothetical protein
MLKPKARLVSTFPQPESKNVTRFLPAQLTTSPYPPDQTTHWPDILQLEEALRQR